jgi:hypothetical protein
MKCDPLAFNKSTSGPVLTPLSVVEVRKKKVALCNVHCSVVLHVLHSAVYETHVCLVDIDVCISFP